MNKQKDSASKGVSEAAPERVKLVIRSATTDDWIGVAYCKEYAGDPSTIHEYARVHQPPEQNQDKNSGECPLHGRVPFEHRCRDFDGMRKTAPSHFSVVIPESVSLTLAEIRERRAKVERYGHIGSSKGLNRTRRVIGTNRVGHELYEEIPSDIITDIDTLLSIIDTLQAEIDRQAAFAKANHKECDKRDAAIASFTESASVHQPDVQAADVNLIVDARDIIKKLLLTQAGSTCSPGYIYELYAKGHEINLAREVLTRLSAALAASPVQPTDKPIDMLLFCPNCWEQHIDIEESEHDFENRRQAWSLGAEWQDSSPTRWLNPPHRSHQCYKCFAVWRPADVPTNGVAKISTLGTHDTWTPCTPVQPEVSKEQDNEEGK